MINVFGGRKLELYFSLFGMELLMRLDLGAVLRTSFLLGAMMN